MEMMSYKERIRKIKERGYMTGLNGLAPLPPEKIPELYHEKEYTASDNWLKMVYAREYYRGEADRRERQGNKVIEVDSKKALIFSRVRKAEQAFQLGMEARERTKSREFITDEKLNGLLEGVASINERQGCMDAWLAGFHLADEEKGDDDCDTVFRLNFDKMKDMREAYELGDEPEEGTEANKVFHSYCQCVKLLDLWGCDRYAKCLSCPGKFRIHGDRQDRYGSRDYDWCEEDCSDVDRAISDICADYIGDLEEYYTEEVSADVTD